MVLAGAAGSLAAGLRLDRSRSRGACIIMRFVARRRSRARARAGRLAGPGLRVGAVEDAAIWNDPGAQDGPREAAGFDSLRMTAQWTAGPRPPCRRPGRRGCSARRSSPSMRGINPIVSIYNAGGELDAERCRPRARSSSSSRKTVVTRLPGVTTFIVGNEPNSNFYWQPQFDAAGGDAAAQAYEQLLAATYDAIKATRPSATVDRRRARLARRGRPDGARRRTRRRRSSATSARAYRASGRTAPIMDVFDEHVYADTSALPPSMPHAGSTIAEGDYAKLVALLGKAFDGTAQRGSTLPIFYGEYGVETAIPADEGRRCTPAPRRDEDGRRGDAGALLRRGVPARALPAERDRDHGLPRRRRERARRAGSPGRTTPTERRSRRCPRSATRRSPRTRARGDLPRPHAAGRRDLDAERHGRRSGASDGVGVGKVTLVVNGTVADVEVRGAVHLRVGAAARRAATRSRCGRATRPATSAAASVVVAATRAQRRDAATTPAGWVLHASAAATRSSASAAGAAPSRMTRGSAPVKSSTVDGVPAARRRRRPRATLLEDLGRDVLDAARVRAAGAGSRSSRRRSRARRRCAPPRRGRSGTRTPIASGRRRRVSQR